MVNTFKVEEIEVGYHAEGYRIDKTASAMNRYTQWQIRTDGQWENPKPVCFHSLPTKGWCKCEGFQWDPNSPDT